MKCTYRSRMRVSIYFNFMSSFILLIYFKVVFVRGFGFVGIPLGWKVVRYHKYFLYPCQHAYKIGWVQSYFRIYKININDSLLVTSELSG